MLNILHLSDTQLSGAPIRIVDLLNKYSENEARHIVWNPKHAFRSFKLDMVGMDMSKDELMHWLDWADVLHMHNRYARQEIFKHLGISPPDKPSVIQIQSPRESEDFSGEINSGVPISVIAQYHWRQWPEASFLVPNVVDIDAPEYTRTVPPMRGRPVVSYAPSNWNNKGWDDKSYMTVSPILKKMGAAYEIIPQIITNTSFAETLMLKRGADIGIDEVSTGSYHLSSLEYMALGIPCIANIDEQTFEAIKTLTGCTNIPWIVANKASFAAKLKTIVQEKSWQDLGVQTRQWMEEYFSPKELLRHYLKMYLRLV